MRHRVHSFVAAVLLLLGSPFLFGWAKPVPVNFRNLHHPRRDMMLVAAAGPGANLLMACGWTLLLGIFAMLGHDTPVGQGFMAMAQVGIIVNLLLMVFNLLPIPPLDGGRVLTGLLPPGPASLLSRVEPFGFLIVLALLASGVLSRILWPVMQGLAHVLQTVFLFWI